MIQNVFDGWDTSYALGRPPALSARQFDSSRIQVGILFQHHPLTTERARAGSTSRTQPHARPAATLLKDSVPRGGSN